jgi:5-(carboxyamino)imidazole ribonucleotide mutase
MGEFMIPKVMIILGSASDLKIAEKAMDTLEELQISYSLKVASAHRTPEKLKNLVFQGTEKGIKVFIAIAGLAAHLPGLIASYTYRPVIGVPVDVKLSGLDALLASLQTPFPGSVATVGINSGNNGAILAAEFLGIGDEKIRDNISNLRKFYNYKIINDEKEVLSQINGEYFKDFNENLKDNIDEKNDLKSKQEVVDVSIILDSYYSTKIAEDLMEILNKLEITHRFKVISPINSPFSFEKYVKESSAKLFIGIANVSAHLPGAIVALSEKPVLSIPCSNQLNGLDTLLSMVNMPPGVPMGVVAIESGKGGGFLAGNILAIFNKKIEAKLINLKVQIKEE